MQRLLSLAADARHVFSNRLDSLHLLAFADKTDFDVVEWPGAHFDARAYAVGVRANMELGRTFVADPTHSSSGSAPDFDR